MSKKKKPLSKKLKDREAQKANAEKVEEYTDSEEFQFKDLFDWGKKKPKKKSDKKPYETVSKMLSGKYQNRKKKSGK